ncbi:hypothetical protein H8E65_01455 [Candidatus Bathyarchaeota archaeon]|nr:hypothetical protein [Candidatus Bathyarchaeota archaeon]
MDSDDIDPALAVAGLGGVPDVDLVAQALAEARADTSFAILVFSPSIGDRESAGAFLLLANRYRIDDRLRQAMASYRLAGTIATLSPDLPDSVRADTFILAGEGLAELGEFGLAQLQFDQAYNVATASTHLQAATRRHLFQRLHRGYQAIGDKERARSSLDLSAEVFPTATVPEPPPALPVAEAPALPLEIQQAEAARWQVAQALATTVLERGGRAPHELVADLGNALVAEDQLRLPYYDSQLAETVAILRDAGAVIPGKTETTEFAAYDPAPTRNPWNTEHTPGGSSSGSAAAVSSGMCPTALGSQTGGSVIRPAAFCGVVGFKPTYDLISRLGVFPLAWSLDHVGFFTRTVEDATILLNVLSGVEHRPDPEPPKLGLLRGYYEKTADESVWEGLMDAADRLEDGGAEVVELRLPRSFEYVHPAHSIIFATEAASVHEEGFRKNPESYKPKMRSHVAGGLLIPSPAYLRAKRIRGVFAMEARDLLGEADCLLTPSSVTPALRSLKSTGDPAFNAPWSFCGFPSITVPCGLTGDGLPLGLQLTGLPYGEEGLLSAAGWCERILDFPKGPRTP